MCKLPQDGLYVEEHATLSCEQSSLLDTEDSRSYCYGMVFGVDYNALSINIHGCIKPYLGIIYGKHEIVIHVKYNTVHQFSF